ncbi:hypothetical protein [Bdellovibrio bacteriovorus]|uniref:hypothetical protein n=1 Tax=Bdellovibrio bacteriovorus TaxID=959 RepID=UPI003D02ADEA
MLKKIAAIQLIFLISTGCGSAWIIRRDQNGGTIGYRNYTSSEAARAAILRLIHCPEYKSIRDELQTSTRTAVVPMQSTNYSNGTVYNSYGSVNYSGTETQTQYVPVTVNNSWREYTYECLEVPQGTAVSEQKREPKLLFQTAEYPNQSEGEGTINFSKAIQSTTDGKNAKKELTREYERRKVALEDLKRRIGTNDQFTHVEYEATAKQFRAEIQQIETQLTEPILNKMKLLLQQVGQQRGLGRVWEDNEDQEGIIDLTDTIVTTYESHFTQK